MIKAVKCLLALGLFAGMASMASATTVDAEKAFLGDLKKSIPAEKIVSIDELHKTWEAVQAGKSNAVIIDIRTHDEFDAGHILGSNNIDSGHAYTMPKKITDPDTEIWVFCRTQHRASYFVSMLYKYGYKNVYLAEGGVVAWIEKGYPLANEYLGEITVAKYNKQLKEDFTYREGH
ncbi:MAG: rhodanese-like domain-containing protein [Proteobacteria bacterium]|nr:rhodanese-like domain-containing protein [Pseudomonadota bacterium]MBU1739824.1 rhodanese-like domain-containing protein [Pseudomonadota bacterium]